MNTITMVLGILILVCALFLIVSVLLQSSKNHRMSGVVSGGAETFFGKQKGKSIDAKLAKATAVIAVVFAILVFSLYVVNDRQQKAALKELQDQITANNANITGTVDTDAGTTVTDDDATTVTDDNTTGTDAGTTTGTDEGTTTGTDAGATTGTDAGATTGTDESATAGTEPTTNNEQ